MVPSLRALMLAVVSATCLFSAGVTDATVIQVNDLNIIDDPGNPSDGLRYLDITYSHNRTLAQALTAATAVYSNARLATANEMVDLFDAFGIPYTTSPIHAYGTGGAANIFIASNINSVPIQDFVTALGPTRISSVYQSTYLWTDPDGDSSSSSTRDYLWVQNYTTSGPGRLDSARMTQFAHDPPNPEIGWLLVSEPDAIPAPSSIVLMLPFIALFAPLCRQQRRSSSRTDDSPGTHAAGACPST